MGLQVVRICLGEYPFPDLMIKRTICILALIVYSGMLGLLSILAINYALYPKMDHRWALLVSVLLRVVPVVIYFRLRRSLVVIPNIQRTLAVGLGVLAVVLSTILLYVVYATSPHKGVSHFLRYDLDSAVDIWPCIVMLLFVQSRVAERAGKQDGVKLDFGQNGVG